MGEFSWQSDMQDRIDTDNTFARGRAIDKVRKLRALGASSNPNEALAALNAAVRIMSEHGLSDADVEEPKGPTAEDLLRAQVDDLRSKIDDLNARAASRSANISDDDLEDLCELNAECVKRAPDFSIGWVDKNGFVATWTWNGVTCSMISGPRYHNAAGLWHAVTALLSNAARQIRMAGRRRAA